MDQVRKIFKKSSTNEKKASLKHTRSMPFHDSSHQGRPVVQEEVPRLVYRGQRPLKTSDIVFIEGTMNGPEPDDFTSNYYTRSILDRFPVPPSSTPDATPLPSTRQNSPASVVAELGYAVHEDEGIDQKQYGGRQRSVQKATSVACFSRPTASAYPSLAQRADTRGYVRAPAPRGPRESPSMSSRHRTRAQSQNARPTASQSQQSIAFPKPNASRPQLRSSPSVSVLANSPSANIPYASPVKSSSRSVSASASPSTAPRARHLKDMPQHPHLYGSSITGRSLNARTDGRDIQYHDATGVYARAMTAEFGEDWGKAQAEEAKRRRVTSSRSRRSDKSSARH